MDDDEGLYLLHTREFISTSVPIFKLGRSNQLDNRVKQYPNGSKIMLMIKCNNSVSCENNLIKLFKAKFIQKLYYGREYFEGNYVDMIKEICDYVNNINVLITDEITNMPDVTSEIVEVIPKIVEVIPEIIPEIIPEVIEVKPEVTEVVSDFANVNNLINDNNKNDKICDRTCIKCKTKFRYPSTLKTHLLNSSRCSISPEEINLFFSKIQPTVQPIVHPIVQPTVQPIVQNNIIENTKTKNNINNICKFCNNLYSRKDSLERHLQSSFCSKFKNIK